MVEPNAHVLVDTNVIIEAHRVDCWKFLVGTYRLDTVENCVVECETGNQRIKNSVPVDTRDLVKRLSPKKIDSRELCQLVMRCPDSQHLDDGEKHLMAYAITLQSAYLVCSPDKACVRIGLQLGILDSFISLEELTFRGCRKINLRYNYTKKFMDRLRIDLRMEHQVFT